VTKAVIVRAYGGPEVLSYEDRTLHAPGPGELLIRQHAIGLNFIDVYHRTGLYPLPLPLVPGSEGAGEVIAVGPDVTGFTIGDRVGYQGAVGGYAEERLLPAARAVPLPDSVSYETAAAIMLKGLTAHYLLRWTADIKPGDTILVQAAAGGTGQLLTQWGKALGATVIGTAGSPDKLALATASGCDHVINYRTDDFVARVRDVTGGKGVDVVYDGVGKDTFEGSLDCLRPRGLMVSFGNATGTVSIPDLGILSRKGSLYVTRPTTATYYATRDELLAGAKALFEAVNAGWVRPSIGQRFALKDVALAHETLTSRGTTGSTLLIP
jgi:NADPH:quinone reductase